MTTTLANITLQVARLVTRTVKGAATSTEATLFTQLVDAINLIQSNDPFSSGTIWFVGVHNIGLVRPILTYVTATHLVSFAAVTTKVATGDTYELCDDRTVTYEDLKQAVNLAKDEMGGILTIDETLPVVSGQEVYALPTGVTNLVGVEVITDKALATESKAINTHWEERSGEFVFDKGHTPSTSTDYLRLQYLVPHADLTTDAAALDASVDLESLVRIAAKHALRMAYMRFRDSRTEIPLWLNERIAESKSWKANRGTPRVIVHSA